MNIFHLNYKGFSNQPYLKNQPNHKEQLNEVAFNESNYPKKYKSLWDQPCVSSCKLATNNALHNLTLPQINRLTIVQLESDQSSLVSFPRILLFPQFF
jgi:hypothetical protein